MGYSLGLLSGPHDPSTQRVPVAPLPSPRTPTRRSRRSNNPQWLSQVTSLICPVDLQPTLLASLQPDAAGSMQSAPCFYSFVSCRLESTGIFRVQVFAEEQCLAQGDVLR